MLDRVGEKQKEEKVVEVKEGERFEKAKGQ